MSELSIAESIRQDYEDEIERLKENNQAMQEEMARTWKKLDEKENIIKEVREVINKGLNINSDYVEYDFGAELLRQEVLEILTKGSDKE